MNLTVRDKKSPTGLRVHLPAKAMPANKSGKRITTGDYNRQDGFSPGQTIVVNVKGLHTQKAFNRSKLVPLEDLGQSFAKRAGVVVINAKTRKRQLIYAELDANAKSASQRMLLIHPGKNFDEGARYIVALRGLRTASGKKIKPSKGFAALKRGKGAEAPAQALQGHLQDAQARRHRQGQPDARVGLHGRVRARADRAHAADPQRRVRPARRQQPRRRQGRGQRAEVHDHRRSSTTPTRRSCAGSPARSRCPATSTCTGCPPGARFHYSSKRRTRCPTQLPGNTQTAKFECNDPARGARPAPRAPRSTATACSATPTRSTGATSRHMAQEHDFAFCATTWSGMSAEDIPNAVELLSDFSRFPSLADREQQGFLNQLYLGRLLDPPAGLRRRPGVRSGLARPVARCTSTATARAGSSAAR